MGMGRVAHDLHRNAIDGVQGLAGHDPLWLAIGKQTTRVQRHQPIAEAGGHVDVVDDYDDAEVELTAELPDQSQHLHLMGHVQRGQRLVEQDEAALLGQQHGQPDPSPLAAGEGIHQPICKTFGMGESNGSVDLTLILRPHPAKQAAPGIATHLHQLTPEQVLGARQMLGQIGHLTGELPVAPIGQRFAIEQDLALTQGLLARQQLEQGGFARAVVADEAIDLALLETQVSGVQQLAAVYREAGGFHLKHKLFLCWPDASLIGAGIKPAPRNPDGRRHPG